MDTSLIAKPHSIAFRKAASNACLYHSVQSFVVNS